MLTRDANVGVVNIGEVASQGIGDHGRSAISIVLVRKFDDDTGEMRGISAGAAGSILGDAGIADNRGKVFDFRIREQFLLDMADDCVGFAQLESYGRFDVDKDKLFIGGREKFNGHNTEYG